MVSADRGRRASEDAGTAALTRPCIIGLDEADSGAATQHRLGCMPGRACLVEAARSSLTEQAGPGLTAEDVRGSQS